MYCRYTRFSSVNLQSTTTTAAAAASFNCSDNKFSSFQFVHSAETTSTPFESWKRKLSSATEIDAAYDLTVTLNSKSINLVWYFQHLSPGQRRNQISIYLLHFFIKKKTPIVRYRKTKTFIFLFLKLIETTR